MNTIKTISASITLATLLCSCQKASLETTYSSQETKIETFINSLVSKDSVRVERYNGSNRVVLVEGEGEELGDKGNVAFYYAGYTFSGSISSSNLFATNSEDIARTVGFSFEEEDMLPVTYNLSDKELLTGLRNGLHGVQSGEECYILFSGKYGFGKKAFGTINANSALVYHVWVESISND